MTERMRLALRVRGDSAHSMTEPSAIKFPARVGRTIVMRTHRTNHDQIPRIFHESLTHVCGTFCAILPIEVPGGYLKPNKTMGFMVGAQGTEPWTFPV
jgi:hypothetical protein